MSVCFDIFYHRDYISQLIQFSEFTFKRINFIAIFKVFTKQ